MSYDQKEHQYRGRIPPKVWDQDRLEVWGDDMKLHELHIQSMAVGLTPDEVLEYYNLELGDLPPYDRWFFETHYKRGRLTAKNNATAKLFETMQGDSKAILAYLTRFGSDEWKVPEAPAVPGQGEIRIVLDDGT